MLELAAPTGDAPRPRARDAGPPTPKQQSAYAPGARTHGITDLDGAHPEATIGELLTDAAHPTAAQELQALEMPPSGCSSLAEGRCRGIRCSESRISPRCASLSRVRKRFLLRALFQGPREASEALRRVDGQIGPPRVRSSIGVAGPAGRAVPSFDRRPAPTAAAARPRGYRDCWRRQRWRRRVAGGSEAPASTSRKPRSLPCPWTRSITYPLSSSSPMTTAGKSIPPARN
jgi:hypothetical protein